MFIRQWTWDPPAPGRAVKEANLGWGRSGLWRHHPWSVSQPRGAPGNRNGPFCFWSWAEGRSGLYTPVGTSHWNMDCQREVVWQLLEGADSWEQVSQSASLPATENEVLRWEEPSGWFMTASTTRAAWETVVEERLVVRVELSLMKYFSLGANMLLATSWVGQEEAKSLVEALCK